MSIIITILIFGIIILIHEYGHFIVAKKSGVFIEEFAVGMGPKLISKEKDGTLYSIRALPLGGFCKMKGEDQDCQDSDSFNNISVFKRIAIVLAGPLMNFLLAFVIFLGFTSTSGVVTTTINQTLENYPAHEAGIQQGDIINKINNKKVRTYDDINYYLTKYANSKIDLEIIRDNQKLNFSLSPKIDEETQRSFLGITMVSKSPIFSKGQDGVERAGVIETIKEAFWNMIFTIKVTISGLIDLLTFKISLNSLVGPIGLAPVIGETYQTALSYSFATMIKTMLNLTALLSANIGIMNLLPIPALDGGRLIFLTVEAIRGRAISQERESTAHLVGFIVLMAFGLYIAFKDIIRIF